MAIASSKASSEGGASPVLPLTSHLFRRCPVLARRSKEAAQAISDGVFFSFQPFVHLPRWVTGGLFRPEYEDSHEGLSLRLTDGAGETDRFQAN